MANLQEISKLVLPDNLKIEDGKVTDALVLGNGFCVVLSEEDGSIKYVSQGFAVEEHSGIHMHSMSYMKYDTFDAELLKKKNEEALKHIKALRQAMEKFNE